VGRGVVSNGTRLFSITGLDGRSAISRRFRDLVGDVSADLGGYGRLSELEKQLVRRAASLSVMCESVEADLVSGLDVDVDRYGMLCDRIGRLAQRLGLSRLARDIGPQDRALSDMLSGIDRRLGREIDG